jgi:D-alanyl-D-alanine dipeptidase
MTLSERMILFQRMVSRLTLYGRNNGIQLRWVELFRTAEEQKKKYDAGLSDCDGVKNRSKHQDGLAVDVAVYNPDGSVEYKDVEKYRPLGDFWKNVGGTWGHDWYVAGKTKFDDFDHFEL